MMDIKSIAKALTEGNISPEEMLVAIPMLLAEINQIRHAAVQLVDNLDNLRLIVEEVLDPDREMKPLKLD
jgi:hypothetical protein